MSIRGMKYESIRAVVYESIRCKSISAGDIWDGRSEEDIIQQYVES